jgi:hypothetical protein
VLAAAALSRPHETVLARIDPPQDEHPAAAGPVDRTRPAAVLPKVMTSTNTHHARIASSASTTEPGRYVLIQSARGQAVSTPTTTPGAIPTRSSAWSCSGCCRRHGRQRSNRRPREGPGGPSRWTARPCAASAPPVGRCACSRWPTTPAGRCSARSTWPARPTKSAGSGPCSTASICAGPWSPPTPCTPSATTSTTSSPPRTPPTSATSSATSRTCTVGSRRCPGATCPSATTPATAATAATRSAGYRSSRSLKARLLFQRGVMVTNVPWQLESSHTDTKAASTGETKQPADAVSP